MPFISIKLDFDGSNTIRVTYDPENPTGKKIYQNVTIVINGCLSKSELDTLRFYIARANSGMELDVNPVSNRIPRLALDTTENGNVEIEAREPSIELVINEDSLKHFGVVQINLKKVGNQNDYKQRVILDEALNETMKVINILEKMQYAMVCQSSNLNSKYPYSNWIWTFNRKN